MSGPLGHFVYLSKPLFSFPVLTGIVAVLPYASLILTGDLVLADSPYSDYLSFQVPMREFAQREFASGRFPHWNPLVGCGIPMHATQQLALCYPLLTPLLWLFSANIAIKVSMFLHIILCYIGQYLLARRMNLTPTSSAISGLIVTQSGFLTNHLAVGHVAMVLDYAILPWYLLSVVSICRQPSWLATTGFAITVGGMLLIGHPQVPYYALLMGGMWALGSLVFGAAAKKRIAVCSCFISGLIIAILVASIQLIPAIELARDNRGMAERGTLAYASQYALDCVDIFRQLFPPLRGNPLVEIPEFHPPDFIHEKVSYLGILTWCLIIRSALYRSSDRWTRAAALLSIFAFAVSLGNSTILFRLIGGVIPGLYLFRCPARILGVASVFLALLAARGFDVQSTSKESSTKVQLLRSIPLLLVMDAVLMFLLDQSIFVPKWTGWTHFVMEQIPGEIQMSAAIMLASLAFLFWRGKLSDRVQGLLAFGILALDLGYFNVRAVRYQVDDPPRLPRIVLNEDRQFRFVEGPETLRFSKDAVRYSRLVPQATRFQVRMIGTNEGGVLPAACEVLYRNLQEDPEKTLRQSSCRNIVSHPKHPQSTPVVEPLPRVRFIPDSNHGKASGQDLVKILIDEPQSIEVQIETPLGGQFVVADTFYPGWSALIDGDPVQIDRVDNCFRGVQVPAGDHLIQMQFRSESFIFGSRLTIVGSLAIVVLALLTVRERFIKRHSLSVSTPS